MGPDLGDPELRFPDLMLVLQERIPAPGLRHQFPAVTGVLFMSVLE